MDALDFSFDVGRFDFPGDGIGIDSGNKLCVRHLAAICLCGGCHVEELVGLGALIGIAKVCLLYTSDAADDLPCVDLGGRRII